jgi:rhodanese-related sulfurtransferase
MTGASREGHAQSACCQMSLGSEPAKSLNASKTLMIRARCAAFLGCAGPGGTARAQGGYNHKMTIEAKSIPISSMNILQANAILRDDPDAIYLDIRIRADYEQGHVPNSINIPAFVRTEEGEMKEVRDSFLRQISKKLPDKTRRYFVGCTSGVLSLEASKWMLEMGYQNTVNVNGGYQAWAASQFPTAQVDTCICSDQSNPHPNNFRSCWFSRDLAIPCADNEFVLAHWEQGPPTVDTLAENQTISTDATDFVPRATLTRTHELKGHTERVAALHPMFRTRHCFARRGRSPIRHAPSVPPNKHLHPMLAHPPHARARHCFATLG